LQKPSKISQIWKEERLGVQELSGTFSQKNFLLKSYGRSPTKFGTICDKFKLKRTSIQLENAQTVSDEIEHSFQLWQ